jgi:hypothetical protein
MAKQAKEGGAGRKRSGGFLLRRRRTSRPPGEGRLVGVRRIPRSLGGGALGFLVVILFFAGLSGDPLKFVLFFLLLVAVTALAIWALIKAPIRATFDQRWRPHRKIAPLDTTGWAEVAESQGAKLIIKRRPRLSGSRDGIAFKMEFRRLGGARTIAGAVLPRRARRKLVIYPRRANFHTRLDRETGDHAFDRNWRVATADPRLVAALVHPVARQWIAAVSPERVVVRGRTVSAWCPAYLSDADRLRGLLELVLAMAGHSRADGGQV